MRLQQKLLFTVASLLIFFTISCTKQTVPLGPGLTTLTIVNAVSGSSSLIANVNGQLPNYINQPSIGYASYLLYDFSGGNTTISFRDKTDTTTAIITTGSMSLPNYSIHSLFLSGTLSAPDTLLVTDILPVHGLSVHDVSDSTAGIRFVNLSPGSAPISINLQGSPNGSEVSDLTYKRITDFINYSTTSDVSSYIFEFRDAGTGNLLSTYTIDGVNNGTNGNTSKNNVRFRNLTIVFYGLPGTESTFLVNNY